MAANQLVSDLRVKQILLKQRTGSTWVNAGTSPLRVGTNYKVEITFGNAMAPVTYADERYKKQNVNIRLCAKGIQSGNSHVHKDKAMFYTNGTFGTQVSPDRTRTSFDLLTYETTNADVTFTAYLRFAPGTPAVQATQYFWDIGIYASVRDRYWTALSSV